MAGSRRAGSPVARTLERATGYLERHGVDAPRETAERLLMRLLATDRAGLYAREDGLDIETARRFGRALCRRCSGVPLQHLEGDTEFFGLTVRVVPGVFVPRPETEVLVERAMEAVAEIADPLVVDVGTGTGAIALAIKRERPDARVLATDRSERAVALTRENAAAAGVEIEILAGDLLEPLPEDLRGRVDLVVSNPPYVTPEEYAGLPDEVRRDPYDSLVGGTDVHRRLATESPAWLSEKGCLVMEIGAVQGQEVRDIVANTFHDVEVLADLAGRDRIVRGRVRRE